jgi:hypothetical protein
MRLTKEQKDKIILSIRERGVKRDGCESVGITIHQLNDEIKLHKVFRKEVNEAVKEGRQNLADRGQQYLADVIDGKIAKSDKNAVTAAIAFNNAYTDGFKGKTTVQGNINHDVRVISAVPRPKYDELKTEVTVSEIDKQKLKELNSGKPINTVDKVIEGEIIKEVEDDTN